MTTYPHRPQDHMATCHCGRTARYHVSYGSGCGNVCGTHKLTIQRRTGRAFTVTGPPILVAETAHTPAVGAQR
jgi:hypothetical protein